MQLEPKWGWKRRQGDKLTDKEVEDIILNARGKEQEYADKYNCTRGHIVCIIGGRRRGNVLFKMRSEGRI